MTKRRAPSDATRTSLPYGSVMATAAASELAGTCGLSFAVLPLLLLAIGQAVWIPLAAWTRARRPFATEKKKVRRLRWLAIGPPDAYSGLHTVPLGLAVIASGLASRSGPAWAASAGACLALAWIATLWCVACFVTSVMITRDPVAELDGSWFLVPAALLGAAIATLAWRTGARSSWPLLPWLAVAGAILGLAGYWVVAGATALRMARHGLEGARPVLWWIGMGCAGLAAAALAHVLEALGVWHDGARDAFIAAMATTLAFAILLLVPVIAGSAHFLLRRCRFRKRAAWPPTFSTAVFAFGCLGAARVLDSGAIAVLGYAAGTATLVLWAITALWNGVALLRNRYRGT